MKYRFSTPEHAIEVKYFRRVSTSGFVGLLGYQPLRGLKLRKADCRLIGAVIRHLQIDNGPSSGTSFAVTDGVHARPAR